MSDFNNKAIADFVRSDYFLAYLTYQLAFIKCRVLMARRTIEYSFQNIMQKLDGSLLMSTERSKVLDEIDDNFQRIEATCTDLSFALPRGYLKDVFQYMEDNEVRDCSQYAMLAYLIDGHKYEKAIKSYLFPRLLFPIFPLKEKSLETKENIYFDSLICVGSHFGHNFQGDVNKVVNSFLNMVMSNRFTNEQIESTRQHMQTIFTPVLFHMERLPNTFNVLMSLYFPSNAGIHKQAIDMVETKIEKYCEENKINLNETGYKYTLDIVYAESKDLKITPLLNFLSGIFNNAGGLHTFILEDTNVAKIKKSIYG